MVNFWLRSNSIDTYKAGDSVLYKDQQSERMQPGDNIIMYIFDSGTKEKYLVGVYEFIENLNIKPITILPKDKWVERPELDEWRTLLYQSLKENTNFDLDESKWVGRIASQGLKLVEEDFKKLKELIKKYSK